MPYEEKTGALSGTGYDDCGWLTLMNKFIWLARSL
jgi:hypothetical protein